MTGGSLKVLSSDFSISAVSGFPSPRRRLVAVVTQCLQTENVVARGLSLILRGLAIGAWKNIHPVVDRDPADPTHKGR